MSSINPVILMTAALAARGSQIGKGFVASLTLGAGQFCTNPGLIIALDGPGLDSFIAASIEALSATSAAVMLHPGICSAYQRGVDRLASNAKVKLLARGQAGNGVNQGQAALFVTSAESFLADETLKEEVFGASSLIVRCRDLGSVRELLEQLEGQLTVTLHIDQEDIEDARSLMPILERKAGRILTNGWPTGVEVTHAMVHGGPFPATSDARSTSVGTLAIQRFLRPVCYQDVPAVLLPEALRDDNPLGIWRKVDGVVTAP
jgi:NADP-dependent aldehyde dehydrogenase